MEEDKRYEDVVPTEEFILAVREMQNLLEKEGLFSLKSAFEQAVHQCYNDNVKTNAGIEERVKKHPYADKLF